MRGPVGVQAHSRPDLAEFRGRAIAAVCAATAVVAVAVNLASRLRRWGVGDLLGVAL